MDTVMSFPKLPLMNCLHTDPMTIKFTLKMEPFQNKLLDTVPSIKSPEKNWKQLVNM